MISLNDVLLAASSIPVDDPIAEIWGRGLQGGYKIIEYTGSLPITISANGDALLDYRIYGAEGGVGEPTENLIDESTVESGTYIDPNSGDFVSHNSWVSSDYIAVTRDYINLSGKLIYNFTGWAMIYNFYDSNKSWLGGSYIMQGTGTIGYRKSTSIAISGVSYVRVSYRPAVFGDIMLVEGSTAPTSYIPYGYKLPMTVQKENEIANLTLGTDGVIKAFYVTVTASKVNASDAVGISPKIAIKASAKYYIDVFPMPAYGYGGGCALYFLTSNNAYISGIAYRDYNYEPFTFTTPANAAYIVMTITNSNILSEVVDVPIYIGENQLMEDEYVSYGEQKIYRDVGGTLTPTDPPVPLPEIPTIEGTTIIDYDGDPKPSQMYIKYKGKSDGA